MKLNPSHADRWIRCPGSIAEVSKYPVTITKYKNDGIAAHKLLERCINLRLEQSDEFLNNNMFINDENVTITSKIIESVNVALDYIYGQMKLHSGRVVTTEQKVDPKSSLIEGLSGSIDVLMFYPKEGGLFDVEIIDFKDGFTPVDVVDNWQLLIYAWGVRDLYPKTEFANFKLTILQPNNKLKGMSINNSVDVPIGTLLQTHATIIDAIDMAKTTNPPLVAGEKQCMWCPAKGGCSAFVESTTIASGLSVDVINMAQQAVDNDPKVLSDIKLREIFEASPMIKKMLEAVEAEIMKRFEDGHPVAGMKIVKGAGRKAWAFEEPDMAVKLNKMGIPKDMVYEHKLLSFNKVCELKWKKRNDEVVSLSKRQIETLEKEYVKKGEGKNTVVLESDPRPAVEVSVSHLFNPIEQPTPVALPDWI